MSNEELKLKLSVIISATNTSGNQKLDAIMELFNQLHPSPTHDVTEAVGEEILRKLNYYRDNEILSDEQMKPINYAINTVIEILNK